MPSRGISKSSLKFLKDLRSNNNREWFNANKHRYQEMYDELLDFANVLIDQMSKYDNIETPNGKKSLMRIYRDVRFSKDKSPYKSHMGGGLKRATKQLRGGYYYHIEPGNSFVGGGFWAPNSADLKLIRDKIAADDKPLRKIINSKRFKDSFGTLDGEQVKSAPKGFLKDHPAIDLLRYKQFLIGQKISDKDVTSDEFLDKVVKAFKDMRPFFDYMSEALTTDINGVPLYN